jgi:predicted ArsR family transcriptional regulator
MVVEIEAAAYNVTDMQLTLDHNDRQFLAGLNRLGSSTIQGLCQANGVTATAVRQRLTRLTALGLVERTTVRAERGRPHHVYRVTATGQRALADDSAGLARLLWREIRSLRDASVRAELLARLREGLVERYRSHAAPPPGSEPPPSLSDRFIQLRAALQGNGFDVDVEHREQSGRLLPILREHACPYPDLTSDDGLICDLEQSVFEEVLGVPVALTRCCRKGDACCEFEPVVDRPGSEKTGCRSG